MNRILLIAKRDYLQTVRSKAFLIGLVFLPLLSGGGFLALALANKTDVKVQRVAVVDQTGVAGAAVIQACEEAMRRANRNAPAALASTLRYRFEEVKPEPDEAAQLVRLSDEIRRGELSLMVDIGPQALRPSADPKAPAVRYYSNSGGVVDPLSLWLPAAVNAGLRQVRLLQLGLDPGRVAEVMRDADVVGMSLVSRNPSTGAITGGQKKNAQSGFVAFFLVFLLIMIGTFGSASNLGVVAQDKMQRVFELLLTSASPWELMAGKVMAAVGTCLTSSTLYILAGLAALMGMALIGVAPIHLIPWFFVYLVADAMLLSALAVALGSACANPQDAQQLAFLLILPLIVPMFLLAPVMQQPNGTLAVVTSFLPPFTPVLMLLRQASPAGVPAWEPWAGLLGIAAYGLAVIWAAARIFRIGILSQGKTPKIADLAQWVLRG